MPTTTFFNVLGPEFGSLKKLLQKIGQKTVGTDPAQNTRSPSKGRTQGFKDDGFFHGSFPLVTCTKRILKLKFVTTSAARHKF